MTTNEPIKDPHARLKQLLAIAERDRTDDEWDEIVELEIQLSPGNKVNSSQPGGGPRENAPAKKKMPPRNPNARPNQQGQQNQPNQPGGPRKSPRAPGLRGKRTKDASKPKPEQQR